jgi:hypothetical protein
MMWPITAAISATFALCGSNSRRGAVRISCRRALLLAAWLSARLNWTLDSASTESGSGQWEFAFRDQGKSRQVKLTSTRGGSGEPRQLCAITFHLPETEEACFAARKTADGGHLETLVSLSGERKIGQLLSYESLPESQLIGQELEYSWS